MPAVFHGEPSAHPGVPPAQAAAVEADELEAAAEPDEAEIHEPVTEVHTVMPAPAPAPEAEPGFLARGRLRRRARYLRRLREVQLRDIGGFVLELHRFGQERAELVQAKVDGAAHTDAELRALERALGEQQPLRELREAGIGGACEHCGAVHGSENRFCASCGAPLRSPRGSGEDSSGPGLNRHP